MNPQGLRGPTWAEAVLPPTDPLYGPALPEEPPETQPRAPRPLRLDVIPLAWATSHAWGALKPRDLAADQSDQGGPKSRAS